MSSTTATAPTSEGTRERSHRRKVAFLGPFASYSHQVCDPREMGSEGTVEWAWDNLKGSSRKTDTKTIQLEGTLKGFDMATGLILPKTDIDLGLWQRIGDKICFSR